MAKIQIICTKPGMRRNGIEHPASTIYDEGRWTDDELDAFRADPSFIVQEVAAGGVTLESGDIEAAVAARVEITKAALQAEFEAAREKLQASYDQSVKDAVAEKIDAAKADAVKDIQARLDAANAQIKDLQEEAKQKASPKK